jgi:DNA-binding PadR family transcriptional regulator
MAVLRLGNEAYPPAVRAELERRTSRAVSRGAVYITLDRLESKGLLGSKLAAPETGARPRRYYQVAGRGRRAVNRALSALEQMRQGIEPLLGKA